MHMHTEGLNQDLYACICACVQAHRAKRAVDPPHRLPDSKMVNGNGSVRTYAVSAAGVRIAIALRQAGKGWQGMGQ